MNRIEDLRDRLTVWLPRGLMLAAAAVLSACGGGGSGDSGGIVGDGVKPDHLEIFANNNINQNSSALTYQCELMQLRARLVFSDGTAGDFTRRVSWSSSSKGVAEISNRDIPVVDGSGVYDAGVVVPHGGGTAVIRADYQGLKASFQVQVGVPDPNGFRIVSGLTTDPNYLKPLARDGQLVAQQTPLWLANGTTYPIRAVASLNGVPTDVSTYALWGFQNGGDPGSITVSTAGVVSALQTGARQVLELRFPSCETTVTLPVNTVNIHSVSLVPEFGSDPLVVGNTEQLRTLADLGNDDNGQPIPQQDVSVYMTPQLNDTDTLTFVTTGGVTNIVQAASAGAPAQISYTGTIAGAPWTTQTLQISTTDGTLQTVSASIGACPAYGPYNPNDLALEACPGAGTRALIAGSFSYIPLRLSGSFALDGGATLNQDITRQAQWSVDDPLLATVTIGGILAGQLSSPIGTARPAQPVVIQATGMDENAAILPFSSVNAQIQ